MSGLNWLEVLADPVRLRIVRALLAKPYSTEPELLLAGKTDERTLNRHLAELANLGMLVERRAAAGARGVEDSPVRFGLREDVRERLPGELAWAEAQRVPV